MSVVACLGDSITAGSPLWDPDPALLAQIGAPDERSQWEWWAAQANDGLELHNHGVCGERTDEIAARFERAVAGADALVVQGGINDIVQRLPVEDPARNLRALAERGRQRGLRVALVDVLPWNNGYDGAAREIARLNELIEAAADELGVPLFPFHATLAHPERPDRMRDEWTDDGNHPSIAGHRLLGEQAFTAF